MRTSIQIYVFDDNSVKRFPFSRFTKLWEGDADERVLEYAGKKIKYAEVALMTENRQPVNIIRIGWSLISVDSEGKFDQNEIQELLADALASISIANAAPPKQYSDKYSWTPTKDDIYRLNRLIFKT